MSRRPHSGKKTNLSQFGLIDIPDLNDDDEPLDLSDDDIDLEAELAAISGGQRRRPKKPPPTTSAVNLDAMIAESLKDIPSNDEASGDDDDPELLNELAALSVVDEDESPPPRAARPAPPPPGAPLSTDSSTISLLQDRITNYTVAEKNAKANGESSRARRFGRGLKTLQDLLKQAKAGKPVMNEDIPPPVTVGKAPDERIPEESPRPPSPQAPEAPLIDFGPPEPSPPAPRSEEPSPPAPRPEEPSPPEPSSHRAATNEGLQIILARKNEFKAAALEAKRNGNKALALNLLKVTKQFDIVVEAYKKGEAMDLNELPTVAMFAEAPDAGREDDSMQNSAPAPAPPVLVTATTLEEGLKQRLAAFRELETKAKEEGNMSKARRMSRITKQYADAIKQHAAGRAINTDELPAPAGFGPLPSSSRPQAAAPAAPARDPSPERKVTKNEPVAYLLQEQRKFKEAALFFKRNDNLPAAKGLLRMVKYYEPIIEDARAGKRVHLDNVVVMPYSMRDLEARYGDGTTHSTKWVDDLVSSLTRPRRHSTSSSTSGTSGASSLSGPAPAPSAHFPTSPRPAPDDIMAGALAPDASIDTSASHDQVFSRLQHQLELQRQLCQAHYEHNMKIGNIAEAKKIEPMIQDITERLDVAFLEFKQRGALPRFHYEVRQFSIVQCNTHLSDSDLELTIVRGIAYNVTNPKDIDTYVKFEFPFPQEAPVSDRTVIVKDTNNPEYNQTFNLSINRTRACLRVFKRHGIKFEVWSRG
ncbi:unnamed protein product [Chrysodeixis includens]|nr:unnamed protein product [Chrysodeixis includens]